MPRIAMLEGYGDVLPAGVAEEFQSSAQEAIDNLRDGVAELRDAIESASMPEESRRGLLSALPTYTNIVNRLQSSIPDVIAGNMSTTSWLNSAQTVRQGIDSAARDIGQESYFSQIGERLDEIGAKIEKLGQNLGAGLDLVIDWSKWILPGALIGGALLFFYKAGKK